MKKLSLIVFCAMLLMLLPVQAFANTASKQSIVDTVKAGVTVGSKTKRIPDKYAKVVADFLNANDFTQEELEMIQADLNKTKADWAATKKLNFDEMTSEQQLKFQEAAKLSASKVGAKVAFDGQVISITDKVGRVYNVIAKNYNGKKIIVSYNGVIKTTGLSVDPTALYVVMAAIGTVLAGAFASTRKYRFN